MIDPVLQRRGGALYPLSDDDRIKIYKYPENMLLSSKIYGSKKARSYRELCCFKGSCQFIADQTNKNPNMDTKKKVSEMTKIKLGFIEGTFVDPFGNVHFITKSLNYDNCDQPEAHRFISAALEDHAALVGMNSADEYVFHLSQLGQGYAG